MTVVPLQAATAAGVATVGGKALGLGRLHDLGLPVPPAAVLDVEAHERWRAGEGLDGRDRAALERLLEQIGQPVAVRSSAVDEDAVDRSAAGQYDSVMGVRGMDGLLAAVEHCYREAEGHRARAYRGETPARVALVVQREERADRAGIAFSADPLTGDRSAVVIEAVFGHGEGAVSGTITPDRFRVTREGMDVRGRIADKRTRADGRGRLIDLPSERRLARTLRDDEARAVARLTLDAEAGTGAPVDVEFCFAGGELWAVQCRRITTNAGHG